MVSTRLFVRLRTAPPRSADQVRSMNRNSERNRPTPSPPSSTDAHRIARRADVALDDDTAAVARSRPDWSLNSASIARCAHHPSPSGAPRTSTSVSSSGCAISFAGRAVDQQHGRRPRSRSALFAGTDNRRNAHRTRHDRRMARAAADLRDKTGNRLAADLRGVGRRKVVRHNNARLGDRVDRDFPQCPSDS